MNKKVVIAATAIIVIIAVIAGVFLVMHKNNNEPVVDTDQTNQVDEEIKQKAEDISKDIPNLEKEDVENILKEDTTDEQKYSFNESINKISIDDSATFDDEGKMHVTDADGSDVVIDEHPHQDIIDMTDEEAEEEYDNILDELNKYLNEANKNNQNSEQDTQYTPSNQENNDTQNNQNTEEQSNSQSTGHTGDVWDQEFYDSLTNPADKKQYEDASDANRIMMKAVMEQSNTEDNNNQSSGEVSAEEYMDSWSSVGSGS